MEDIDFKDELMMRMDNVYRELTTRGGTIEYELADGDAVELKYMVDRLNLAVRHANALDLMFIDSELRIYEDLAFKKDLIMNG